MTDLFPPFAPEGNESRKRLFRPISFRVIVPNIITLLALCLGLTAIRFSFDARWDIAVFSILGAAVLDGLDGRVARLLKGTSRFGAELDSLADFISFGVAPALLLYSFSLSNLKSIGWLVALIFAMSMALRLARFNAMIDAPSRPDWQHNFFTGVPAPAGAMLAMLPVYLSMLTDISIGEAGAVVITVYTLLIAFLTISTIPVYSGKNLGLSVPRHVVLPLFIALVVAIGLVLSFPFTMMTLISLGFLSSIPFGFVQYRRLAREEAKQGNANTASTVDTTENQVGSEN
ncbi:CDP-diacylglycerol--serine O-phosphatidyltransferase [Microvirga sp. W0021]|uniref:CDP-diacylglycerol--serine O-phosphatidyltransferase n=1 Tax=Hohaiivirga grylli TaxID=3133970 RepID=A0ABV0BJN4_9HYPH